MSYYIIMMSYQRVILHHYDVISESHIICYIIIMMSYQLILDALEYLKKSFTTNGRSTLFNCWTFNLTDVGCNLLSKLITLHCNYCKYCNEQSQIDFNDDWVLIHMIFHNTFVLSQLIIISFSSEYKICWDWWIFCRDVRGTWWLWKKPIDISAFPLLRVERVPFMYF